MCFFIKLARYVNHCERMNSIDFGGNRSKLKVTMGIIDKCGVLGDATFCVVIFTSISEWSTMILLLYFVGLGWSTHDISSTSMQHQPHTDTTPQQARVSYILHHHVVIILNILLSISVFLAPSKEGHTAFHMSIFMSVSHKLCNL